MRAFNTMAKSKEMTPDRRQCSLASFGHVQSKYSPNSMSTLSPNLVVSACGRASCRYGVDVGSYGMLKLYSRPLLFPLVKEFWHDDNKDDELSEIYTLSPAFAGERRDNGLKGGVIELVGDRDFSGKQSFNKNPNVLSLKVPKVQRSYVVTAKNRHLACLHTSQS